MGTKKQTKMKITSWDENPYRENPDGTKFNRAEVVLARPEDTTDGVSLEGSWEALLYYRADGTSSFVGLMRASGTVDGREGSFALQGAGTYDGTQASMQLDIVEGSGTGELAGISGTAESVSTHADYPYMPLTLSYHLD